MVSKNVGLMLLLCIILYATQLNGQFLPINLLSNGSRIANQSKAKIRLFNDINFDTSSILIGIRYNSDSALYKNYCFIVDNLAELNRIKQQWILTSYKNEEFEQNPLVLYVIKKKAIIKYWYVFPKLQSIATEDGYLAFDTAWLSKRATKHYLNYKVETDTFTTKSAFVNFKQKIKLEDSLLFLVEPNLSFEGNFVIKVENSSLAASPDDAVEKLTKIGNRLSKDNFSIFNKLKKEGDDMQGLTYVAQTNKVCYDRFSDINFKKGDWIPNLIIVKSYWKE